MTSRTILILCGVAFAGSAFYQLSQRSIPSEAPRLSSSSSAYGPSIVSSDAEDKTEDGEYGLIEPEDDCHSETVCASWSGCLAVCNVMKGGDECFSDCVVDERLETLACENEGLCSCDTSQQFCAEFCRADG